MATTTVPTRFELDAATLAGALALAGVTPSPGCGLPEPVPLERPERALRHAGALDDAGALAPAILAALQVAASPERVLKILVDRPGATSTKVAQLIRTAGRDEVVSWARTDDTYSFTVLGSVNQAVILVDDLLSITDLLAGDGTEHIDLSPAGLAALLAAADSLREDRLRAQLGRVTTAEPPALTASRLEEVFALGLTTDDSRWAVTAIRVGAPIDLGALAGQVGQTGLAELRDAKLVTAGRGGDVPTERGTFVFGVLGQLVTTASLAVTFVVDGTQLPVAPLTLLRTATTIWAVAWSGRDAGVRVTLADLTVEGALGVVSDLLETMTHPGVDTAAAAAPRRRAPLHAPSAPAWAPTDLVPAGGMPARANPDPTETPIERLGEGLGVKVAERRGDWARVVCENGWTGWVDARYLQPVQ